MSANLAGPLGTDDQPWERQRGESRQAYAAWTAYRDQEEPRSYRRLAQHLDRSTTLIGAWGSKWHWQQRLDCYLRYLEKVEMAERTRAIVEMNRRHAAAGKLALDKVTEALDAIEGGDLPITVIPKLLTAAVAIERMANGISETWCDPSRLQKTRYLKNIHVDLEASTLVQRSEPPSMVEELEMRVRQIPRHLLQQAYEKALLLWRGMDQSPEG